MNCLACTTKNCRALHQDCNGLRASILDTYHKDSLYSSLYHADQLVSNGRAGTLSRVDEIIEYAKSEDFYHITLAYCFSIERLAEELAHRFRQAGLRTASVRCSVNGIAEQQLIHNSKESVSCNPVGQATAINQSDTDLVVEMGLCLGHDIIFHRYLKKPFTVFMVKDRVYNHIPQQALTSAPVNADRFIELLPSDFYLKKPEWVDAQVAAQSPLIILDLRGETAFKEQRIPHSINCTLSMLPRQHPTLLPDKNAVILTVCSGGLQSMYAVMYLRMQGYSQVFSMSGGFSRWLKEEREIEQ